MESPQFVELHQCHSALTGLSHFMISHDLLGEVWTYRSLAARLAARLDASLSACKSGKPGHLLQIFIRCYIPHDHEPRAVRTIVTCSNGLVGFGTLGCAC
eukprot:4122643-Amphidinium_carterae.2